MTQALKNFCSKYDGRRVTRIDEGGYSILDTDILLEQLDFLSRVAATRLVSRRPDTDGAGIAIVKVKRELRRRGIIT